VKRKCTETLPKKRREMMKGTMVYKVCRAGQAPRIDGNFDKLAWKKAGIVLIGNRMGAKPAFMPYAQARMMYSRENLYLIFRVRDRYVRCLTAEINGPVWEDACIEFFFAPDTAQPGRYFNLEVNCLGIPLMHYNTVPDKEIRPLEPADIRKIEIANSLPGLIDPELKEPVTWTVEYRIPIGMLEKYSRITCPEPGVEWRANFYKIAENSSNPHYLTWSPVKSEVPNFHLPDYFGLLKFG
jgi:hypothetical protein